MNKNEISSTLFRFVSVRNPQLIRLTATATKFVIQDTVLAKGTFYDAVTKRATGTTKFEALTEASKTLTGILPTEKEVRALYSQLAAFSDWIAQNKENYTDTALKAEAAKVTETFSTANIQRLWDNLFYQIITAKDFYAKEALMQMLHAYHVKTKLSATDAEVNKTLMNATVAIPPDLFLDDEPETKQEIPAPGVLLPAIPTQIRRKELEVLKYELANSKLESLKKEISNLKDDYQKGYKAAYDTAATSYEKTIEPILDTYNQAVERNRKSYCSTRTTSGLPYDEKDPCQQPELVPYPKLPKFEFSYEPEVEPAAIERKLSYEGKVALLSVVGYDFESENIKAGDAQPSLTNFRLPDSFDSLVKEIDTVIAKNTSTIISNRVTPGRRVTIGGITLPVNTDTTALYEDGFMISPVKSARTYSYNLQLGTGEADIQKVVVTQKSASGTTTTKSIEMPSASRTEGTQTLNNVYSYTSPDGIAANAPDLTFDIHLNNGAVKSIQSIKPVSIGTVLGTSKTTVAPVIKVNPVVKQQFPITRHGVKKVGIADYLKVEQSVQCYVEGEVSHIENIMAREYKEKSTRRLTRTEDTTTTSSETEREQLTDTTTADRFEMQSETAKVVQETKDFAAQINGGVSGTIPGGGSFFANAGLNTATSNSREDSNRIAVTEAKEITERALDRVVKKVKEERIRKVTEEFEENNRHGFDNRKGSQHVVGVYRWVDKLYKNQVVNYGRRLMYEFMIPEPAKLHLLGMAGEQQGEDTDEQMPDEPINPRLTLGNATHLNELHAAHWAGVYNVDIDPKPEQEITVGASFSVKAEPALLDGVETNSGGGKVTIPDGYKAYHASGLFNAVSDGHNKGGRVLSLTIGNINQRYVETFGAYKLPVEGNITANYSKEVPVSYTLGNHASGDISVTVKCQLTVEAESAWKLKAFNAIITGYEAALEKYNQKKAAQITKAVEDKKTNPGFYRQIENTILRKNCISYLIDKNPGANNTYGRTMFNAAGGNSFTSYEVNNDSNLTNYAAYVKFIEQAFEWDIISYSFYPFYWGSKNSWKQKYQFDESIDPTFRNFMQSGMARVMVTVRPGFEEAVQHFMATGIIWNGGKIPVIGSSMYLSVAEDLKQRPVGTPEGKAWLTRVPTALTILQAGSAGLKVEKALPCDCTNADKFENPDMIPCGDNFELNQNLVGGPDAPETEEPQQMQTMQFTGEDTTNALQQEIPQEPGTQPEEPASEETEPEQTPV